ncbi:hypothetical protein P170DRAFT_461345 [Aspergillus steynii IBT 23096]|uniref:Uncharacterized protein n=1 Tax=Aspergillus steynii IBT 23096 TaxID=1392250 RepID=A0A2I2GRH6_9EURO|nr:uncharacterized protein P170DRAFT_461345 [Aspergillus steynii IBT 23096]PLB55482.1 hypothetical protein P170DRAFT_461345 [Aspergillus steynii IBT 23096]
MQLIYIAAALAAITTAHAIDASATPSSSGVAPHRTPDTKPGKPVERTELLTSSVKILLNYDKNCYFELTDIQGCTGKSAPFGTVSKTTGNCENNGAYPLIADICDGQIWIYTHGTDNVETYIPPLGKGEFVTEGMFWFKNSTGHVNDIPYVIGYVMPGCEFYATHFDEEFGLVSWSRSCYY